MEGKQQVKRSGRGRNGRSRKPAPKVELAITHPNAAGIDLGSRSHWVSVPPDRCEQSVRDFSAYTPDLRELADWLQACRVDTVAMEATGVYWIPLYELLEARKIEVYLVNAQHARAVPGRKSDVLDCQWLRQLHTFGLLRRSFRPTAEIVRLRSYLRQRETLVRGASVEIQHMQKALTLMNVQLHIAVSDITGLTGMRVLRAIVAGERCPKTLAQMRDARCRSTVEEIEHALTGNYQPEHVFALRQALALYDKFEELIAECDQIATEQLRQIVPEERRETALPRDTKKKRAGKKMPQQDLRTPLFQLLGVDLARIAGIAPYSTACTISEIGTDMTRWPTVKHFASWLCLAPGTRITGGKVLSARTRPSSNRAAELLRIAAVNVGRTDTALGAFYRRLASRKEKSTAVVATAHKLARIIYTVLKSGETYQETEVAAFEEIHREKSLRNLRRKAQALEFTLVANEVASSNTHQEESRVS